MYACVVVAFKINNYRRPMLISIQQFMSILVRFISRGYLFRRFDLLYILLFAFAPESVREICRRRFSQWEKYVNTHLKTSVS